MPDNPETNGPGAESLLDKLHAFASTLEPEERQLLAALLAPGIDAAWGEPAEVTGFTVSWSPDHLPDHLSEAIRGRALRVEGW
jgi:hypothetical protein